MEIENEIEIYLPPHSGTLGSSGAQTNGKIITHEIKFIFFFDCIIKFCHLPAFSLCNFYYFLWFAVPRNWWAGKVKCDGKQLNEESEIILLHFCFYYHFLCARMTQR